MLTCDVLTCIATFRIMDASQPCGSAKKNSESLKFSDFEKRRLILPYVCDLQLYSCPSKLIKIRVMSQQDFPGL